MDNSKNLLNTISQISQKLIAVHSNESFIDAVLQCLALLGESTNKDRLYIWKNHVTDQNRVYCNKVCRWVSEAPGVADHTPDQLFYDEFPTLQVMVRSNRCVNRLRSKLANGEKQFLELQKIKAVLLSPIIIDGKQWGFIGVDNCEEEVFFSSMEEDILITSSSLFANVIEKMEKEAALREAEERTQLMLDAMPLCCNLWTEDCQNIRCNDEAVRLFELSSQQEYLERFFELSPPFQPCGTPSDVMAQRYIMRAFAEGHCRFEWMHQKLDATPIPAEVILVRVKYKEGIIVAGYTRDLREEKAMLEELKTKESLRLARDQALMNSKAKSNFLANMSHEIRTPINAISGFSDIILRESSNANIAKYAQNIKDASGSLIHIINDVLDISKIESGKLEICNAPYELGNLISDVVNVSRMRLGNKPLMFITDIDSRLPAQLLGDENRVKQILFNMISNAIKYTNEGYFSLQISATIRGNRATLQFTVKDSGVGIKEEDLGGLFDEFERVNTTKNRSVEGTGLGLTISKELCEMMGGYIQVNSTYGKGSEFIATVIQECLSFEPMVEVKGIKTVLLYESRELYRHSFIKTLENLNCKCVFCINQSELYEKISEMPYHYILTAELHLKKVQDILSQKKLKIPVAVFTDCGKKMSSNKVQMISLPVNCLELAPLLNGQHKGVRDLTRNEQIPYFVAPSAQVLIVDDNRVNLQVAQGLMIPYQFEIDIASNGVEAFHMIKCKKYDLVFMDHMMPEMDGIDATIAIRKLPGEYYQKLPIIALTANTLVGTREMFIREGMNDFLAKPININKLAHLLIKWLPRSKVNKLESQGSVEQEEKPTMLIIPGIDTIQGIQSVGGNQKNYLQILTAYHLDGREKCLSLLRHIASDNIEAFRIEVHALKSISATIGAFHVSEMAGKLEAAAKSNDMLLVKSLINEFLLCFEEILNAILQIMPNSLTQQSPKDLKRMGDMTYLRGALKPLENALETANVKLLEDLLNGLLEFQWSDEITKKIQSMEEHLDLFDYDSALECVMQLKNWNFTT